MQKFLSAHLYLLKIYASTVQFKNKFYVTINEEGKREFISSDDDVQFIIKVLEAMFF
ncbi:hypothetical protein [Mycoplasmopsis lipofaciens]|uniref:hypothetical protein n=1 Tax=Mycoplasmopsis lipofaciens TaxID=114884 RepID=UPI000AC0CFBF|nr:hypothetical protein [Mycoplasmopsis lipofaciens]